MSLDSVAPPHTAATDFFFPFFGSPERTVSDAPHVSDARLDVKSLRAVASAFIGPLRIVCLISRVRVPMSDMPMRPTTLAREGRATCSDALSDVLPPSSCDYRVGAVPNVRAHQFNRPRSPSKNKPSFGGPASEPRTLGKPPLNFSSTRCSMSAELVFFVIARIPPRAWSPRVLLQLARTIPVVPATSKFWQSRERAAARIRTFMRANTEIPPPAAQTDPRGSRPSATGTFFSVFRLLASAPSVIRLLPPSVNSRFGIPMSIPPPHLVPDACRDIIF
ncbi:hypothetical protein B0H15DRAFT_996940 [Mycena belliarum]|uniref:Uncharacterized protein n=1 Tax=Mycena belliarum TaxID=1033014 RepID=A0AAD6XKC3_9AGAR|nr:hypothetical protein B0H15DRAFT_996940 [Mycena belliae]